MDGRIRILLGTQDRALADLVADLAQGTDNREVILHHCLTSTGTLLLASQYMPDAVLVDERLPDAENVLKAIRLEDPRTLTILLTGNAGRRALGTALDYGARDCLSRTQLQRLGIERCLSSVMVTKAGWPATATAVCRGAGERRPH